MIKTILVLPDGREISSGPGTGTAVQSCTYTACVNSGTELTLGSACSAAVDIKLLVDDDVCIAPGDRLTVYKEDGNARRQLGVFYSENPRRSNARTLTITAYDAVTKLDRDLTEWLSGLEAWPYSVYHFAHAVCDQCGVSLANAVIPNGTYLVHKFGASGVTGRQLMQWIGEIAGLFLRATDDGQVELAWYTPLPGHSIDITNQITPQEQVPFSYSDNVLTLDASANYNPADETVVAPNLSAMGYNAGTVEITGRGGDHVHGMFAGSLKLEGYDVAPIQKVQIRADEEDIGVLWPNDTTPMNTYIITGNPLLSDTRPASLEPVAKTICEQLRDFTYTPLSVEFPACLDIRPGHILTVLDRGGNQHRTIVMTTEQRGMRQKIACTGSPHRESVSAVNELSLNSLNRKVMHIKADVDGLRFENKDAEGRLAALQLTVDGLDSQVHRQTATEKDLQFQLTALQQTADAVQLSVQRIRQAGVSKVRTATDYTFDEQGLKIARAGQQMENLLDNTGMYVRRGGEVILQASAQGVKAVDVKVNNYLMIGDNARFEDYAGGRTACFYTGG